MPWEGSGTERSAPGQPQVRVQDAGASSGGDYRRRCPWARTVAGTAAGAGLSAGHEHIDLGRRPRGLAFGSRLH